MESLAGLSLALKYIVGPILLGRCHWRFSGPPRRSTSWS